MEKYIIENQDSFNLKDIFECGQCFRWNKEINRKLHWSIQKLCTKCGKVRR